MYACFTFLAYWDISLIWFNSWTLCHTCSSSFGISLLNAKYNTINMFLIIGITLRNEIYKLLEKLGLLVSSMTYVDCENLVAIQATEWKTGDLSFMILVNLILQNLFDSQTWKYMLLVLYVKSCKFHQKLDACWLNESLLFVSLQRKSSLIIVFIDGSISVWVILEYLKMSIRCYIPC